MQHPGCVPEQTLPQLPQLDGSSACVSMQLLLQQLLPLQVWSQPPQLLGSEVGSMQLMAELQ